MAQTVVVKLTDDIDGKPAAETVSFAIDGKTYEIDLSSKNASKLRSAFAEFVEAGRRVRSQQRRGTRSSAAASDRALLAEIREWARQNGHVVADRGRIAAEVTAAYHAAHPS